MHEHKRYSRKMSAKGKDNLFSAQIQLNGIVFYLISISKNGCFTPEDDKLGSAVLDVTGK